MRLDDVRDGEEGHHGDEEGGEEGGKEEEEFAEAVVGDGEVVFVPFDVGAFEDGGEFFGVGGEGFEVDQLVLRRLGAEGGVAAAAAIAVGVKGLVQATGVVGAAGANAGLGGVGVVVVVAVGVPVGHVVVAVALGVWVDARAAVGHGDQ